MIDGEGAIIEEGRLRTTPAVVEKEFSDLAPSRIAMEAGMQSLWVSSLLTKLGHEVLVANVRELRAITHSDRKSDKVDARKLARYARLDPQILRPITHRNLEMHKALLVVRTRAVLVRLRTTAVNAVRGLTKPFGYRVPACSTAAFSKRCRTELPGDVLSIVEPLLLQIEQLTAQIEAADQRIDDLAESPTPKRWHQQEYPA